MADEVYRFTTADGQEHAWHGAANELKKSHPGATISGVLVMDELEQGSWEPISAQKAMAADPVAPVAMTPDAVIVEVEDKPAKKDEK